MISTAVPAAGDECVYVVQGDALLVVEGGASIEIPTGVTPEPFGGGLILAGERAYVSYLASQEAGRVVEIDLAARAAVHTFEVPGGSSGVTHADGKLYVGNRNDDTLTIIDVATGSSRLLPGPWSGPFRVAASDDGAFVSVGDLLSRVYVLEADADEIVASFEVPGGLTEIVMDGRTVLVASQDAIVAFEPDATGYRMSWEVTETGISGGLVVAGGKLFSALRFRGDAPVLEVRLDPPHTVQQHPFSVGIGIFIERTVALGAGAESVYASSFDGLFALSPETGEISLLHELDNLSGVAGGHCYGDPLPTPTPTPTATEPPVPPPTPATDSCVYLTDVERDALIVIDGDSTYAIPAGLRKPRGIALADDRAFLNHAECCPEGGPPPPQRVTEIDLSSRRVVRSYLIGLTNEDIEYAGGKLYLPYINDGVVNVIDVGSHEIRRLSGPWAYPSEAVAGTDGRSVFIADWLTNRIYVLDSGTDGVVASIQHDGQITELAAYEKGLLVAAGSIVAYEEESGSYVKSWEVRGLDLSLALAVAGSSVFSASFREMLVSVSLEPPHTATSYPVPNDHLSSLDADDGNVYATGRRGLYQFSVATEELELLRESSSYAQVRVGACPGQAPAELTPTPTPSPSATATSSATATTTRSPTVTATGTETPTAPASVGGSSGGCTMQPDGSRPHLALAIAAAALLLHRRRRNALSQG